jgi:hypothetical protein
MVPLGHRTSCRPENSSDDEKARNPMVQDRHCKVIAENAKVIVGDKLFSDLWKEDPAILQVKM